MADYTVFADVSKAILDLLRSEVVPEPVASIESIGVCDPKDRGSFVVGIHPYNMRENHQNISSQPMALPDGRVKNPPISVILSVAISVSSKAEPSVRALDEQRILGRIMQVFLDNPKIPRHFLSESLRNSNENVGINMLRIELEEKVKIWSMFGESYKLSVFYDIGPVSLDSTVIRETATRVSSTHVKTVMYDGDNKI